MRSFNYYLQVARPQLIVITAFATWITAMLSNGPDWFTTAKIASPAAMALSVLGASLYHFGAANPMYTRKSEALSVRPLIRVGLIALGLVGMFAAIYVAFAYLNAICQVIVVIDAIIIVAYASILSRHWLTKNLLIALVCVSPILLGWFAGHRLHPSVPYGITVTFFVYLAREIIKDIQDRVANNGYRVTLPLWLGVRPARLIAASILCIAMTALVIFGIKLLGYSWYVFVPYALAWGYFLRATYSLVHQGEGKEVWESKQVLLGSCWLMLTFFLLIF